MAQEDGAFGLTRYHRQLEREGQAEEDHWYRTYAPHEGCPKKVQEWLPDRCTKGIEGTSRQGRIKDASVECCVIWEWQRIAYDAKGIWSVILANAINGTQLQWHLIAMAAFLGASLVKVFLRLLFEDAKQYDTKPGQGTLSNGYRAIQRTFPKNVHTLDWRESTQVLARVSRKCLASIVLSRRLSPHHPRLQNTAIPSPLPFAGYLGPFPLFGFRL